MRIEESSREHEGILMIKGNDEDKIVSVRNCRNGSDSHPTSTTRMGIQIHLFLHSDKR